MVTGTGTGVGKTVATAALALRAATTGSVVVVKPVQTGVDSTGTPTPRRCTALTGCAVQEYTALDEPLAPDTAARRQGVTIPPVAEYADRIRVLTEFHDTVLVEGAGGLLVRLDSDGGTLLDLAAGLTGSVPVEVVVVAGAASARSTRPSSPSAPCGPGGSSRPDS